MSVKSVSPVRQVEEPYVVPIQVIKGKRQYFIGSILPKEILQEGQSELIKSKIAFEEVGLPHMTIIPPNDRISPNQLVYHSYPHTETLLEPTFTKMAISNRSGWVCLWVTDPDKKAKYQSLSHEMAKATDTEKEGRPPHIAIAKLSDEQKSKIFQNPEDYGFTKHSGFNPSPSEFALVVKDVKPITMKMINPTIMPPDQLSLSLQLVPDYVMSPEDLKDHARFLERAEKVKQAQQDCFEKFSRGLTPVYPDPNKPLENQPSADFLPVQFTEQQLGETVNKPNSEKIPLTFSTRVGGKNEWLQFKAEVHQIFEKYHITDATAQAIGSGVHGFSRNPTKPLKSWTPQSDMDIAIFSKTLMTEANQSGVTRNEKMKIEGCYRIFKNALDAESCSGKGMTEQPKGWYDTPIGHDFSLLAIKWSQILYPSSPETLIDFKLNISAHPFNEAAIL